MSENAERAGKSVPLKLFVSYAHEDEEYRAALEKYLVILKLQGLIEHWDDRKIAPGDGWGGEIDANLNSAHIIVLLVSIEFVNSGYIWNKEMKRALERASAGEAVVVPVLVRVTEGWKDLAGLGSIQALPLKPGAVDEEVLPIKKWDDPDEAWGNVVRGLTRTIRKFHEALASLPAAPEPAPPTTSTPAAAEASAEGVKALRGWLADPKVRAVAKKFRADFAAASERLVLLSDLKELHDHLHNLQFQCYSFVVLESRRSETAVNWESLDQPEIMLRELAEKMQNVAQRPSLASLTGVDLAWITELATARVELHAGVDAKALKSLKSSAYRIGRVLAIEPLQINIQLSAAAASLPLAEIEQGMAEARGELSEADLASPEGRQIGAGVTALAKLRPGVARLTKEHTLWQGIDAEMRCIERQLGQDTSDLEFAWNGLKTRLLALCTSSQAAPWSIRLQEEIANLESALAAGIPAKIAQTFRRTYTQAGLRFYDVDVELLELCGDLRNVGTQLDKLLTKL